MKAHELRELLLNPFEEHFAQRFGEIVFRQRLEAECMDLVREPDQRVAFRAAYALESAFCRDPAGFAELLGDRFVKDYKEVSNPSAHRHYTKMLYYLLNNKLIALSAEDRDRVIEVTFDHLISEKTRPAVKVWAMEILYLLSESSGWVAQSLYDALQHIMTERVPSIVSRGRKVCERLNGRQIDLL